MKTKLVKPVRSQLGCVDLVEAYAAESGTTTTTTTTVTTTTTTAA